VRCLIEMEDFINDVWEDRDGRWVWQFIGDDIFI
jgi:hypothetical protein